MAALPISESTPRNTSGSSHGDQARGLKIKVLVDTGPLVAALHKRDAAHGFAAWLMAGLRRDAIIPSPVLVEADHLIRARIGDSAARQFLKAAAGGSYEIAYLTPGMLRRAVGLDSRYADLRLGFADACVMAIAERHELPILTFDFGDFRATESNAGPWRLAIDEHAYQRAVAHQ